MLNYYYLLIEGYKAPFGYLHKSLVQKLIWPGCWEIDHEKRFLTLTTTSTFEQRTKLMETNVYDIDDLESIEEWEWGLNELYPVYAADGEHVLNINNIDVAVFGIVNSSVHMLGWVISKDGRKRYWVLRRSITSMTYPGMLDNTVTGNLPSGEKPIDCIVRECEVELGLDPTSTRANIKACRTASYHMTRDRVDSGCQLQVQYLYEMEFGEGVMPRIGDVQVGEIHLMTLDKVRAALT